MFQLKLNESALRNDRSKQGQKSGGRVLVAVGSSEIGRSLPELVGLPPVEEVKRHKGEGGAPVTRWKGVEALLSSGARDSSALAASRVLKDLSVVPIEALEGRRLADLDGVSGLLEGPNEVLLCGLLADEAVQTLGQDNGPNLIEPFPGSVVPVGKAFESLKNGLGLDNNPIDGIKDLFSEDMSDQEFACFAPVDLTREKFTASIAEAIFASLLVVNRDLHLTFAQFKKKKKKERNVELDCSSLIDEWDDETLVRKDAELGIQISGKAGQFCKLFKEPWEKDPGYISCLRRYCV